MRTALTIAGSDSGGGAGIQGDLKTFAAYGVYGTSAITAVTAQNTLGVSAWQALPASLVTAQIHAVLSDIGADAVKIGMLGNAEIVHAVAEAVGRLRDTPIVVDPVMVAKGGDRLLETSAVRALCDVLLPMATVVTPNLPEAEVLSRTPVRAREDMERAGRRILALGPQLVLVKGGHAGGPESVDLACTADACVEIRGPRLPGHSTHGTGCTLSSAIAANLARGLPVLEAIEDARRYLEGAIRHAPGIGRGHGPLAHMWRVY